MLTCTRCSSRMTIKKTGVPLEERFKSTGQPYKLWMSDVYECACGNRVAFIAPDQEPIAEHFEAKYESMRRRYIPEVTVLV